MIALFIIGASWVVVGKICMEVGQSNISPGLEKFGRNVIVLGIICILVWIGFTVAG